MKIEKFKVLLYLKKSGLDKNGKAPIMGRITVNRTRRSSPASCLALHRFGIPVPADWRARARKPWRPTRTSSSCCFPSKRLSMCLWKRERTSRLRMSRRPCRAASRHRPPFSPSWTSISVNSAPMRASICRRAVSGLTEKFARISLSSSGRNTSYS